MTEKEKSSSKKKKNKCLLYLFRIKYLFAYEDIFKQTETSSWDFNIVEIKSNKIERKNETKEFKLIKY